LTRCDTSNEAVQATLDRAPYPQGKPAIEPEHGGCHAVRWRQIHTETRHQARQAYLQRDRRRPMKKKAKTPRKLLPFDAARYLTDEAAIAEYMAAVL